jgi:hypothetical protein
VDSPTSAATHTAISARASSYSIALTALTEAKKSGVDLPTATQDRYLPSSPNHSPQSSSPNSSHSHPHSHPHPRSRSHPHPNAATSTPAPTPAPTHHPQSAATSNHGPTSNPPNQLATSDSPTPSSPKQRIPMGSTHRCPSPDHRRYAAQPLERYFQHSRR